MCGRNSVTLSNKELAELYSADSNQSRFSGSYNIAPGSNHPVIRQGSVVLEDMNWSFVPEWADSYSKWKNRSVINSRLEKVKKNNLFKDAYRKRKCIVPSTGFYEWKETPTGKQPYAIKPAEADVFSLAGIWSKYQKRNEEVHTFSILTMKPNDKMSEIHNRMPVILQEGEEREWINGSLGKQEIYKYPSRLMAVERVSQKVNDPSNDSKDILSPETAQTSLGN